MDHSKEYIALLRRYSALEQENRQLKKELAYIKKLYQPLAKIINSPIEVYRMDVVCGRKKPAYKAQASEAIVMALFESGLSAEEIAEKLNVSRATIYRRLKALDIKPNKDKDVSDIILNL